jgi:hypothetical protein
MLFRKLIGLTLAFALAGGVAIAAVVDKGPPYTSDQFVEISNERLPEAFKKTLPQWWSKAPQYLKNRILAAPSDMWWPIILCNYQGFRPESKGTDSADKCEKDWYKNSQRGKQQWSADGRYIEPSAACVARNKRSQWGELLCD